MKKVLYGSSALMAASAIAAMPAAAEEGVQLGLGGYYNTYFWVGEVDEANGDPRDFGSTGLFNEGEVHFKGSTTLDNGITFGIQAELELTSQDDIDEHYAFISGSFGRLVIGGENTVAYLMQYGAPKVGVPLNSGWITSFVAAPSIPAGVTTTTGGSTNVTSPAAGSTTNFRTPAVSTYVDLANDAQGVQYYSPRFSGFQIGVGYTPSANGSRGFSVGDTSSPRPFGGVQADKNSELHDIVSVGANFVETVGGIDVALAGGYRRAEAALSGQEDPEQWSGAAIAGFSGFEAGASIAVEDSGIESDGFSYDAGLTYSTGPWSVGGTYFYSEVEGSPAAADDKLSAFSAGIGYAVGPGITASANLLYANWEDETGADSEGFGGVLGMSIGF